VVRVRGVPKKQVAHIFFNGLVKSLSYASMKAALKKLIEKIDPKQIENFFPSKERYDEFLRARSLLEGIISDLDDTKPVDVGLLHRMEEASALFNKIHRSVAESTELGARAHVNEVYHWVAAGHVERSIYLAGVASGKKLADPYGTQIQLLPANACLYRYRQVYQLAERIPSGRSRESREIAALLLQMKKSLLYQMYAFAKDAYLGAKNHPMANYLMAVAQLIVAHAHEEDGDKIASAALVSNAHTLVKQISNPKDGDHYKYIDYHVMNHEEFVSFGRLSSRHTQITARLLELRESAEKVRRDGHTNHPQVYFALTPYLVVGARAASFITLATSAAALGGVTWEVLDDAIRSIWTAAIDTVPGLEEVASHGGGISASRTLAAISTMAHGGGIA
jgi:hypothetical protein